MVMIPPLVRDPPPDGRQSSAGHPVSGRMVRPQRRYASNFNISFEYEPPKPIPKPGVPAPASPFDKWRAAAELDPHGDGAGDPSQPAAGGGAAVPGVAAPPRRTLHDVLLGTTAVVLLGVVGGIGYLLWSGALPGTVASPGGAAPKGSSLAAVVQPLVDLAAKTVPGRTAVPPPAQDGATDNPAARPALQPAALPPLPFAAPNPPVLATPSADKPALPVPPPSPIPGASAVAGEAVPVPERVAAGPAPAVKPSEPDAVLPASALPSAAAEALPVPGSASEPAPAAVVPPVKAAMPDATPPTLAMPASPVPTAEQAAAKAVPSAKPSEPDAALAAPAVASMTVRLSPAPEWTTAHPAALAGLSEAAPLPPALPPAAPVSPAPSAAPAIPEEVAKAPPPGVDAQQVMSTMSLVRQMSLLVHDMHDEGLRYRTEVTALAGAVQAKASNLEERLKLAEARGAGGAGVDGGSSVAGVPVSDVLPVLHGYRVQAGSPGAAVLSDVGAGAERSARLLVMVGDQLPGAGRVTAIVQRGRGWAVRTDRGVIQ